MKVCHVWILKSQLRFSINPICVRKTLGFSTNKTIRKVSKKVSRLPYNKITIETSISLSRSMKSLNALFRFTNTISVKNHSTLCILQSIYRQSKCYQIHMNVSAIRTESTFAVSSCFNVNVNCFREISLLSYPLNAYS